MQKIKHCIEQLTKGYFVIVTDDEQREDEADLVIAAEHLTHEKLNFMLREAGGFVCVPMANEVLARFNIPMMVQHNNSQFETPFTVSVEAAKNVTTGVSTADRLHTIKTLVDKASTQDDIVMPGHVFPLRAADKGIFARQGHTEAAVDLMRLSQLTPVAVICELMNPDGTMMRGEKLRQFAKQHNISFCSIAELRQYRLQTESVLQLQASCQLPLEQFGEFDCHVFLDDVTQKEHVVIMKGEPRPNMLVRMHSQCFTGDVLQSQRCDCGPQLTHSLQLISEQGGMLIYLPQEGRGIGLANKIKSYALQQQKKLDTVEANKALGFADDLREYYPAAKILGHYAINKIRLLTNNPDKISQLRDFGIQVEAVPLIMAENQHNKDYLLTKQHKLNHLLNLE